MNGRHLRDLTVATHENKDLCFTPPATPNKNCNRRCLRPVNVAQPRRAELARLFRDFRSINA